MVRGSEGVAGDELPTPLAELQGFYEPAADAAVPDLARKPLEAIAVWK